MKKSRFGLYQEILSNQKVAKFKELISGKVIDTVRSVFNNEEGEIFLARIVRYEEDYFFFGDPKCWPSNYKHQLESMIENKLLIYEGGDTKDDYENFMKYSGPYWFSCVTTDPTMDILNPDYYEGYLL